MSRIAKQVKRGAYRFPREEGRIVENASHPEGGTHFS